MTRVPATSRSGSTTAAANYPQTVGMSGSDPEGVVTFAFTPEVVEVPAGSMVEAAVAFTAPQPAPGQQLNRQLTVAATNDEGSITTIVTLVQSTAAAPVDAPIRLQVQPSSMRLIDSARSRLRGATSTTAAATRASRSRCRATTPSGDSSFAFVPARFVAVPGHVTPSARAAPRASATAWHAARRIRSPSSLQTERRMSKHRHRLEITTSAAAMATAELRAIPRI